MILMAVFLLTIFAILSLNNFFKFCLGPRYSHFDHIEASLLASFFSLAVLGLSTLFIGSTLATILLLGTIVIPALFSFQKFQWKLTHYLRELFPKELRAALTSWILLGTICSLASLATFAKPVNLPDGAYVYKNWTKNVQVQWASGDMPADNALPYFAGEFLTRKVNLTKIHPFAPGQEIVDRTFVVPLIYLGFRSLDFSASKNSNISYFSYVGTSWPNAMDFYDENLYQIYTGVNIALESFLAFAILLLAGRIKRLWKKGYPAAVLVALFPFFLQQTYFTWTKSFCTALALLSMKALIDRKFLLSGLLISFSYQIHPMALIFFGGIFLYCLIYYRKALLRLTIPFLAVYAIWETWVISTHLKSDLIQQNLFVKQPAIDHVFARLTSLYNFIIPSFMNSYPLITRNLLNSWLISAFALSFMFLIFSFSLSRYRFSLIGDEKAILCISALALVLAIAAESRPSPVQFFGGQLAVIAPIVVGIRTAKTWKIYTPIILAEFLGLFLWLYVVKPL